jgi:hypothetical protein
MRIQLGIATALTATVLAFASSHAAPFYVTTGQSGGVFSVDGGTPKTWTIQPTIAADIFGGGLFVMKRGTATTNGISLSLFDAGNTLIGSASYNDVAAFDLVGGGSQQWTAIQFNAVAAPSQSLTLSTSQTYTVRLAQVGSGTGGDEQYFIKGDTTTLTLDTTPINDIPVDTSEIPEPASAMLLLGGLAALGVARRRTADGRRMEAAATA